MALSAGPVVDVATHAILSKTSVTIAPAVPATPPAANPATDKPATPPAAAPAATSTLAVSIPVGATYTYKVNVSGFSAASVAEAELFAGSTLLGPLPVVAVDAPLAITIDGDGTTTDKPLNYAYDDPVTLTLKNGDAQPYHVSWEFRIDGKKMAGGLLDIAASGNSRVPLKDVCGAPRHTHFWGRIFSFWAHPVSRKVLGPESRAAHAPCSVYSAFIDRIHPSAKQGVLLLSVTGPEQQPGGKALTGLLPAKSIPVNLVLHRSSPSWTTFWVYFYAGVLLVLGGGISVIATSVLPNKQKIGDLRSQIKILASRTTSVSTRVDSYLRVLLRLERSRIKDTLDNVSKGILGGLTPTPDALAQVAAALDTLTKRLTAAERLDDLRRKHDQVSATAPPSVTDSIDANLQAAADQLHSLALSDADLAAANAYLAKAQASLDMLNDTDALAKLIAGNFSALSTRLAKFPNYYADLKDALPGVFVILDPSRDYSDPKNLVRPMLFAIDHGIAAIQLALDFAMVRASIPGKAAAAPTTHVPPNSPAPAAGAADPAAVAIRDNGGIAAQVNVPAQQPGAPEAAPGVARPVVAPDAVPLIPPISAGDCGKLGEALRERLKQRQCILIELLGTLSWRALREATLLVQQMREDTYEEDILEEMKKDGQAEITFDTQTTRPFSPVFFSITFKDARFNDAAALQRLICHWTFPDGLEERCWNVCHYFTGNEKPDLGTARGSAPPVAAGEGPDHGSDPSAPATGAAWYSRFWGLYRRYRPARRSVNLLIRAAVRGQGVLESEEVPIPPLERSIKLQPALPKETVGAADFLRFLIAFGVALAGLFAGALDQLGKLEFIPASIAIVGLGFGANAVKNVLTDSAPAKTPVAGTPGK